MCHMAYLKTFPNYKNNLTKAMKKMQAGEKSLSPLNCRGAWCSDPLFEQT